MISNQEIGKKLSDIGGRLDYPCLTRECAQDIETLWKDSAIQVAIALCGFASGIFKMKSTMNASYFKTAFCFFSN